jgi:hypothetical protein
MPNSISSSDPAVTSVSWLSRKENRWLGYAVLFFITALAFQLRQSRIHYGLPLLLNEDEPIYYFHALKLGFGEWPSQYFNKPGFFLCFYGVFYYLQFLLSPFFSPHAAQSWQDFWLGFWRDPTSVALLGRSISLIFACASVWSIGLLGKRLFGWAVGLIAALWLALNGTHISISSIVISDIPSLFCILLSAHFALDIYDRGHWHDYLLCALAIALTISFKYNIVTLSFLLSAHFAGRWYLNSTDGSILSHGSKSETSMTKICRTLASKRLWWSLVVVTTLFVVLNPMAALHCDTFCQTLAYEKTHMLTRQTAITTGYNIHFFSAFPIIFARILPRSLGWPIYLLGLFSLLKALWQITKQRDFGRAAVVFVFPLLFLLLLLHFQLINAKYLLPVSLFWLLTAAYTLKELSRSITRKGWFPLFSLVGLSIAMSNWVFMEPSPSLYKHPDTRQIAAQIIKDSLRSGQNVLLEPDTLTLGPQVLRFGNWLRQNWSWQEKRWKTKTPSFNKRAMPLSPVLTTSSDLVPPTLLSNDQLLVFNLGAAVKLPHSKRYIMRFPDSYYRELAKRYRLKKLLTPFPIRNNDDRWRCRWASEPLSQLYAELRQQKGKQDMPGPILLILERI